MFNARGQGCTAGAGAARRVCTSGASSSHLGRRTSTSGPGWHIWSQGSTSGAGTVQRDAELPRDRCQSPSELLVPAFPRPPTFRCRLTDASLSLPEHCELQLRAPRAAAEQSRGSHRALSHGFLFPVLRNLSCCRLPLGQLRCPGFPTPIVFGVLCGLFRNSSEPDGN